MVANALFGVHDVQRRRVAVLERFSDPEVVVNGNCAANAQPFGRTADLRNVVLEATHYRFSSSTARRQHCDANRQLSAEPNVTTQLHPRATASVPPGGGVPKRDQPHSESFL